MLRNPKDLDPISLEILHNALRSITDEAFVALMKSAYSTNIKERNDHSSAIIDIRGRLVVQAARTLPMHLGSMLGLLDAILRKYPVDRIDPGDIFVANDPYEAGGTHLPDVNLAMPIFVEGRLIAFICNIAHHSDIGGMAAGGMAGKMSEIYQEGLRIPVVKLLHRGELDHDLLDVLLLNVRVPRERRGDYFAQIAACRLGERRVQELARNYSAAVLEAAFDEFIRRTERRMRAAISKIPEGSYSFEDFMDDDGLGTYDIPIRLRIDVMKDRVRVDFTGTSPQVRGNINCPISATRATVGYALKALLDPSTPNNEGVLEIVEVVAEKGTVAHAAFPAAIANRQQSCQRIADMIIGALAPALPEAALGASHGATVLAGFSGNDPATGQPYIYFEVIAGGAGARATKDGKSGVQVHTTNTSNLPVEAIEMEYPLLVESYGLVQDSGGAGRQVGGLALRRIIRPLGHSCVFTGHGERFRHNPWGIFGGHAGRPGRFVLLEEDGTQTALEGKAMEIPVGPGQRLMVEAAGAGGYGDPAERDPALVLRDWREAKFSPGFLKENFGFTPPE